jgi:hypothetical protein
LSRFEGDLRRDRDSTGDLVDNGERVAGEVVEYKLPIADSFPVCAYSPEQIIELHRARNASRVPPPPRPGSFHTRSMRRI